MVQAKSIQLVKDEKGHEEWQVTETKKDGTTSIKERYDPISPMEERKAVLAFCGFVAELGNKRLAACTLLATIMRNSEPGLDSWRGKSSPMDTPRVPNTIKEKFRELEDNYFNQFIARDKDGKLTHADGAAFVKTLPREDGLKKELKTEEERFQVFKSGVRKDPSYANAKNLVLEAWCVLGQTVYDESGRIIPPEILRQQVAGAQAKARSIMGPDHPFLDRVQQLYRAVVVEEEGGVRPMDDELPESIKLVTELLSKLQDLEKLAAQRRTNMVELRKPVTAQEADKVIRDAAEAGTEYAKQD